MTIRAGSPRTRDPSRTFFYHRGTHETRWEPPPDHGDARR